MNINVTCYDGRLGTLKAFLHWAANKIKGVPTVWRRRKAA
jgi:hypothetical protein